MTISKLDNNQLNTLSFRIIASKRLNISLDCHQYSASAFASVREGFRCQIWQRSAIFRLLRQHQSPHYKQAAGVKSFCRSCLHSHLMIKRWLLDFSYSSREHEDYHSSERIRDSDAGNEWSFTKIESCHSI